MRTWWQDEELNADLLSAFARVYCRGKRKPKKETLLFGLEENLFLGFWVFFSEEKKRTKFWNVKPFKLQNWNNFVLTLSKWNTLTSFQYFFKCFRWTKYSAKLGRMCRISSFCQFCLPVFLFCYIYSIVKFLIRRPPKPNQGLALPPAHSNQASREKWNFLGCYNGLLSQGYIHTKGKTS